MPHRKMKLFFIIVVFIATMEYGNSGCASETTLPRKHNYPCFDVPWSLNISNGCLCLAQGTKLHLVPDPKYQICKLNLMFSLLGAFGPKFRSCISSQSLRWLRPVFWRFTAVRKSSRTTTAVCKPAQSRYNSMDPWGWILAAVSVDPRG